ncbi:hypothetical protein MNBD_GAMMA11-1111 [hydrothermal vent metagenome]|uniref:Cytoplasmic protein USSDB7A n=1 Tax=hydrothermal vent metagenome TaxID=652676 RepID=A0A3B0WTS3_9ZZZZ
MAIYIEYDGIEGDVTADGYAKHFAVEDFSFGVGRAISMESGNMANRESTRPSLSEVVVTKELDKSSASLFSQSVTGTKGTTVKIKFVRTGEKKIEKYLELELKNVLVSSYSVTANSEGMPTESLSLSYTEVLVSHFVFDGANANGTPYRHAYSLEKGKSV